MNPEIEKKIIELWVNEFGGKEILLETIYDEPKTIKCFKINNLYVRLDSFLATDKGRIYCIEAADHDFAIRNIFDDAWNYWDGDGIDSIINQMRIDLSKEFNKTA